MTEPKFGEKGHDRACDLFTHWTTPGAVGVLQRQAILFARSADDVLGILVYVVTIALRKGVFVLRLYIPVTDVNALDIETEVANCRDWENSSCKEVVQKVVLTLPPVARGPYTSNLRFLRRYLGQVGAGFLSESPVIQEPTVF
jgi:hypothetical protein